MSKQFKLIDVGSPYLTRCGIESIDEEYFCENMTECCELLNELYEENQYLKKRLKQVEDELYCKDRTLEDLGQSIECCDKKRKRDYTSKEMHRND